MSGARDRIEDHELSAAVDGRLPPERAAALEAHLDAHPEERARLQEYSELQQELRNAFAAQDGRANPEASDGGTGACGAAAAPLLAVRSGCRGAAFAGSRRRSAAGPRAVSASGCRTPTKARRRPQPNVRSPPTRSPPTGCFRSRSRHPVEVDATQEAHLVQWLSKRLGHPLVVPDLTKAGFQLIGGRLLPSEGGPAAQFMYQKWQQSSDAVRARRQCRRNRFSLQRGKRSRGVLLVRSGLSATRSPPKQVAKSCCSSPKWFTTSFRERGQRPSRLPRRLPENRARESRLPASGSPTPTMPPAPR